SAISENIRIETQTPENLTALSRDTQNANEQVNKQDLKKVQEQQEMAKVIGEISNNAIQIATYEEREKINKLSLEKFKAEEKYGKDSSQAQQLGKDINQIQENIDRTYGIGSEKGMAIRAVTAALQAAAQNDSNGAIVALASPYLNQKIHEMTEGDTAKDKATNLIAHALLSAVEFQVTGKDPLTGAVAGVTGEVTAEIIAQKLYEKSPKELTASEKENISTLSQLAGGLAGALTAKANGTTEQQGGSFLTATAGAETAKRAVENNYLYNGEVDSLVKELAKAEKEGKDTKPIFEKYAKLSERNRREMLEECGNNPVCYLPHMQLMNTGDEAAYENVSGLRLTSYFNGLSDELKAKMSDFVEQENAKTRAELPQSLHYGTLALGAAEAVGLGGIALKDKLPKLSFSSKDKNYPKTGMDNYQRKNVGDSDYSFTYRGDSRTPKEIFNLGFFPRGNSTDLLLHARDNTSPPSNFVSTSISQGVAINFATNFGSRNGYVYAIKPNGGIDVNRTLGSTSPYPSEQEIAIPYGINPKNILGVTPVDKNGKLGNHSILNR
ncbi:scabin-related ADP-ribosyltransferase, partial [Rodentibacter genomosp. 1]|uniref:scabin-related ADP-ribosyltransferase n=1 Tax=Rodentibacter genomosp. 1 TaxID=1908264 RepID=UPI001ABF9552